MEKLAFIFTGQGAQFSGMGKQWYDGFAVARQTYEEASELSGVNLAKLCFEGSLSELSKPELIQIALVTTSIAGYRAYREEIGIAPHFVAGHSLGEYSALVCAGALSFGDAIKLVQLRGSLTKQIMDSDIGGMTIVDGLPAEVVEEEIRNLPPDAGFVTINCYNSPNQVAIAGHQHSVEALEERIVERDGQISPLLMSAPFHTPLMETAAARLKEFLQTLTLHTFRHPVISNVTARPYGESANIVELLSQQSMRPVRWQETMAYLKRFGVTHAVEFGPKNVLTNLVAANTPGIEALCYAIREDRKQLSELFHDKHHLRKHIPTVLTKCLAVAVSTPNVNWDSKQFEEGVEVPYKRLQAMHQDLEDAQIQPTLEQMEQALTLLKQIMDTKHLPEQEKVDCFHHILEETGTQYLLKDTVNKLNLMLV
ncbi:[acyl-carrier-protein] S-malonyltransferase [Paenibacillus cellulosilyticus]|uniref:[acyl-carrier-protein] S-malonyltransferase n=1 Tax=Paenibacillus cellulosilyticus TaxID=375489 RepID=A0A2V2YZP1_9BACL|nr:ACP S-malonyltransferase [Paenibacillus cellulosilyticus]PWW07322.1 [acyl-carrier-protein] S-malonyltransferase [Paenibacillus cellulosilyticus]QKS44496.1 ACP S-malonyltransferase [Paenibacillus cellulosilyticus]